MSEPIIPPPSDEEKRALLQDIQHGVAGARDAYTLHGEDLKKWRVAQKK